MLVFAGYLFCMHVIFVLFPDIALPALGFDPPDEVWVRILGYVVGSVAFYHYMAVRQNIKNFYWWSAYARFPILPTFALLVWMGKGPPTILVMGTFDSACALWTWLALKKETRPRGRV